MTVPAGDQLQFRPVQCTDCHVFQGIDVHRENIYNHLHNHTRHF